MEWRILNRAAMFYNHPKAMLRDISTVLLQKFTELNRAALRVIRPKQQEIVWKGSVATQITGLNIPWCWGKSKNFWEVTQQDSTKHMRFEVVTEGLLKAELCCYITPYQLANIRFVFTFYQSSNHNLPEDWVSTEHVCWNCKAFIIL